MTRPRRSFFAPSTTPLLPSPAWGGDGGGGLAASRTVYASTGGSHVAGREAFQSTELREAAR